MPKLHKIEGLWIPESLEEARQIIPDIDEEQFRKWQEDGAVELRLVEVYRISRSDAAIERERTYTPCYRPVPLRTYTKINVRVIVEEVKDEPKIAGEVPLYVYFPWTGKLTTEDLHEFKTRLLKQVNAVLEPWRLEVVKLTYFLDELVDIIRKVLKEGKAEVSPASIAADVAEPDIPEVKIVLEKAGEVKAYHLEPNASYVLSLQKVSIPPDLLPADVEFRSSFHRCGWVGRVTNIDPGFEGHVWVLLSPTPGAPDLFLEAGARVVQMRLYKLSEPVKGYRGQWQHK